MTTATALSLRAVTKRFGATVALDAAALDVRPGTVHALLGENGAGKTTLMRIAYGLQAADAGEVRRADRLLHLRSPRDARSAGIGMVHQHFMLVPAFTVAENVMLGGHGRLDARSAAERVRELAAETGLAIDPRARVGDLPVAAQQRAELIRALAERAEVLILDEPTAVLTPSESDELYRWMRRFAADGGSVVLITHKLREALAVADDVTVLRHGKTVLAAPRSALNERELVHAVVGAESPEGAVPPRASLPTGEPVLTLDAAGLTDVRGVVLLAPTSLTVRGGEILGVLGVDGAGQDVLLRLLCGRLQATTGRVRRPARVGFIPGDRLHEGLIPEMSLVENAVLAEAGALRGRVPWRARGGDTAELLAAFDVRAPGPASRVGALSGGNQQKFVVGRERRLAPQALVAEHPTRGLDVRATAHVLGELRAAAAAGCAVVVHSTDLDEILALTRRVVVCFDGHVTEVPPPDDPRDRGPYARALLGVHA